MAPAPTKKAGASWSGSETTILIRAADLKILIEQCDIDYVKYIEAVRSNSLVPVFFYIIVIF